MTQKGKEIRMTMTLSTTVDIEEKDLVAAIIDDGRALELLTERLKEDDHLAKNMANHIDIYDLAREVRRDIDISDIVEEMDITAKDVAECFDASDIASEMMDEISVHDIVDEIDLSDVAEHIDLTELAREINPQFATDYRQMTLALHAALDRITALEKALASISLATLPFCPPAVQNEVVTAEPIADLVSDGEAA